MKTKKKCKENIIVGECTLRHLIMTMNMLLLNELKRKWFVIFHMPYPVNPIKIKIGLVYNQNRLTSN